MQFWRDIKTYIAPKLCFYMRFWRNIAINNILLALKNRYRQGW